MQVTALKLVGIHGAERRVRYEPTAYFFAGGRARWPSVKLPA